VSNPWFEIPLVTEWYVTSEGGDTKISARNIEQVRVKLREMPSILNTPGDVLTAMNQFDVYVAEKEKEQMDEQQAQINATRR